MTLELHLKAGAGVHKLKKVVRYEGDGKEGKLSSSGIRKSVRGPHAACLTEQLCPVTGA